MPNDVTIWMNEAGKRRLEPKQTEALLQRLSGLEEGTPKYRRTFDRIVEGNLLLVAKTVEKLMRRSSSLRWGGSVTVDLLQVGCLGLAVAVQRFDASRGTKLSTCAVPWIRQRVSRWLNNNLSVIYVPENTLRAAYAVRRGEKPGKSAPKNPELIHKAMHALTVTSLERSLGNDGDTTLVEVIACPTEDEKPRGRSEQIRMLRDVMAKAGIEPRSQNLMLAYAQCGRAVTAAKHAKVNTREASGIIKATIAKCQEVV